MKPLDAKTSALRIIDAEHKAFDAALAALVRRVNAGDGARYIADPERLDRTLSTISTFMESFHHPKEDDHLFRLVRERTRDADDVLVVLQHDHANSPRELLALRRALAALRPGVTSAHEAFSALVESYARGQLEHMRLENEVVLPLAERVLAPADWVIIESAFRANRDPVYGNRR